MADFLIYDAKVAVLIAVFYMFYRLMLAHETFHRINRAVLLLTAVASFILPLCVITFHETVILPAPQQVTVGALHVAVAEEAPTEETAKWWMMMIPILFIIGVVVTLCRSLWSIIKVCQLIRRSEKHPQDDGITLCVTGNVSVAPFSWMHYIVMNRSDYEAHDAAILAHERGHIRLRHSFDVFLVDTLTALQWFNPAMWMLRSDLRSIHEYEADGAVLSSGINARQYQYLLITKAASIGGYSIANGINHSTLKNRITMMIHTESPRSRYMKLLALLPIVGMALALNAETVKDVIYQQPQKQIVKKGTKAGTIKMGNQKITVVEAKDNKVKQTATKQAEKEFSLALPLKSSAGKSPLIVIDGKVSTEAQVNKLKEDDIDNINIVKNEEAKEIYAKHFNADTSNGIIFINTKEYVKNGGGKNLVSAKVTAKPDKEKTDKITFDVVEEMPQFPGGDGELMKYLSSNVRYPKEAMGTGKQGRVIVKFVIEEDGKVVEPKVLKSVSPELDAEALRVVKEMPNWIPGKQNGKVVRVHYTIPITFRLS